MPPISFWFTGTALYLAASFVFAIGVGLIGIKDMIPKKLFYVLLAFAVLLSGTAWHVAAQQEQDSFNQDQILDGISKSIGKIASATNVNPNQSSNELAEKIIKKFNDLQSQINQTKSSVQELQNPPPDPNTLYQDAKPVANVISATLSADGSSIIFGELDNVAIDFNQQVSFRGYVLQCTAKPGDFMFGTSPTTGRPAQAVYTDVSCSIITASKP